MAETEIIVRADHDKLNSIDPGLVDLINRCYKPKPDKKDLRELRGYMDSHPDLWEEIFNLTQAVRDRITQDLLTPKPAQWAVDANVKELKQGMGYDQSPTVERLLIDHVINTWLRCQWAEYNYSTRIQDAPLRLGEYWLQVLGSSQRRYLMAVETLARVRRITRATMQINIAEAGSQQVNIAGDLVKPG